MYVIIEGRISNILPLSGLDGDIGRGVDGADPSSDVEPGDGALLTTEKQTNHHSTIEIINIWTLLRSVVFTLIHNHMEKV